MDYVGLIIMFLKKSGVDYSRGIRQVSLFEAYKSVLARRFGQ